ncbi:MAG TPA: hypothetical protein VFN03_11890 [Trueperaceae bacterium]|nr:hypothetical protein [Trueperaceae bacterium]
MAERVRMLPVTDDAPRLLNLSPLAQLRAGRLPRRLAQLFFGLSLFGVSIPLMLRGSLGAMPWDVLHVGLSRSLPFSVGTIMVLVSFAVLLLWIPLRQMPGLGTVANAVWIGIVTDVVLRWLPVATALPVQLAYVVAGIALNGLATAMYIGSQLGPGPRDGLMTGLSRVSGLSLRVARTSIEIVVVAVGWLLGGVLGFGTLAYALAVGPLTQYFLPFLIVRLPGARQPVSRAAREPV